MRWREMWEDYCEFVSSTAPFVLGLATVAFAYTIIIFIALVIVRWLCL